MTFFEERWLAMRARLEAGEVRLPSNAELARELMDFGRAPTVVPANVVIDTKKIGPGVVQPRPESIRWFVTWGIDDIIGLGRVPVRNGCPTCGCDECGCNARSKPMGCYVDDCEGCRCATSPMPPCGHCETHGIDLEPCSLCGCDMCGCTPEREDIRAAAAAYPELVP